MKLSKRKIIFAILSIICMVVIFCFSARNADLSTQDSNEIGLMIGEITIEDFNQWPEAQQISYAESIDHPVRKMAHFLEYMTLGMLLFGAIYDKKNKYVSNVIPPFIIGAVYAATDELHQTIVSGRSGQITDVLLDSAGVLTGLIIISLIISLIHHQVSSSDSLSPMEGYDKDSRSSEDKESLS